VRECPLPFNIGDKREGGKGGKGGGKRGKRR
jgi:hypothetical protein